MEVIVTKANAAKPGFQPESTSTVPKVDDLVSRVVKLIPGEVAAGYTALLVVTASAADDPTVKWAAPIGIALCVVLIVMLIRRAGEVHQPPITPHPTQYIISVLAFVAWAFSIRNPLDGFHREVPVWITGFAIVLLPIFGGLFLRDRPPRKKEST